MTSFNLSHFHLPFIGVQSSWLFEFCPEIFLLLNAKERDHYQFTILRILREILRQRRDTDERTESLFDSGKLELTFNQLSSPWQEVNTQVHSKNRCEKVNLENIVNFEATLLKFNVEAGAW